MMSTQEIGTAEANSNRSPRLKRNPATRMDSFHLDKCTYIAAKGTVPTIESVFEMLSTGDPGMAEHINLIRDMDWGSTSIGPISGWPQEMSMILYLAMLVPQPRLLMLGSENVLLYNQAYGRMIRDYHPRFFGKPLGELEEWSHLQAEMAAHRELAKASGRTQVIDDFAVPMMTNGRFEEVYISFTIVPQPPPLIGYYLCFQEVTDNIVRERQRSTLRELESWGTASDLQSLYTSVLSSVSGLPYEFPFAAIYSARTDPQSRISQEGSEEDEEDEQRRTYYLEGAVGDFDAGVLPATFEDHLSSICPLRKAVATKTQIVLSMEDGTLPDSWSRASLKRGFGDICSVAVICPSSLTRYQRVEAVLVFGLPTRRPLNDAHRAHIHQLHREFADVVNSTIATTEAACRRRENARRHQLEKDLLAKELALRQKEANLATSQVNRVLNVIEQVDVGIFEYSVTGELIQANSGYHRLSGYPTDLPADAKHVFRDLIHPEESDSVNSRWESLLQGNAVRFETRYKSSTPEGQWVLAACMPVRDEDGVVTRIIGCITDIAAQKRDEQEAKARLEALERARASDERFFKFTQLAPVGIMIADVQKGVQYANDAWFDLSAHPRVPFDQIDWNSVLHEDDIEAAEEGWQAMLRGEQTTYSLRLKRLWYDSDGQPRGPAWLMVRGLPEFDEDGNVVQVMGITIDISHLKFAESHHRSRMEEAVEAKRQQENFIDMTSHEIRNPLSAVVHCADSISDSLKELGKLADSLASKIKDPEIQKDEIKRLLELIESSTESVDTISTCSEHQKRIVTDILTLSKLDSKLLQITPSSIRADSLLSNVGKMFEVEAERVGVEMELVTDRSIQEMNVDRVHLDSGRVLQVLINIITNAIKFTKGEAGIRQVKVVMGASRKKPHSLPVDFTLTHNVQDRVFESPTLEKAEEFYLWWTVKDSGRGMTVEERSRIFSRFAQGSPRTYNEYGGSGLGLFISRELVELQGGEIGVSSESGKGSTFAFFVKTQLVDVPISHALPPPLLSIPSKSTTHRDNDKSEICVSVSEVDEPPQEQQQQHKTRVLVVEDNAVNQRVLTKQLSKHGYIVHVASNGQEALDFLDLDASADRPRNTEAPLPPPVVDVILMDIEMPVMDGISCAKRIRELERRMDFCAYASSPTTTMIMTCESNSDDNATTTLSTRPRISRGDSFNSIRSFGSDCCGGGGGGGSIIGGSGEIMMVMGGGGGTRNRSYSSGEQQQQQQQHVSSSSSRRIPIIAISANARPEQTNEAILAGMDDAVSKPFRVVDLTPRIDFLVGWARGR